LKLGFAIDQRNQLTVYGKLNLHTFSAIHIPLWQTTSQLWWLSGGQEGRLLFCIVSYRIFVTLCLSGGVFLFLFSATTGSE